MNQLYLDLCKVKALCISAGVGKGTYRRCLLGRVAQATGVAVIDEHHLGDINYRFMTVQRALRDEVPGDDEVPGGIVLTFWNDAENTTQADVLSLIDRAAMRASS